MCFGTAIKFRLTSLTATILFALMVLFLNSGAAHGDMSALERIRPKEFPENWHITREFQVPRAQVEKFEAKFAAAIEAMYNQLIAVGTSSLNKLQINYVVGKTERDAIFILRQMVQLAGQRNVFLQSRNVVIEIIGTNIALKKEVVEMMNVSKLQKEKFTSTSLPDNWKFVREIAMTQEELQSFSQVVAAPVNEVINQFFLIDRERVQLNYIDCNDESDAEKVQAKLTEMVGKVNTILQKGTIVFEIISATPAAREEVAQRIDEHF